MAISLTITECEAFIGRELTEREAQARGIVAKTVEDFKIEYDKDTNTPLTEYVRQNEDFALKRVELQY